MCCCWHVPIGWREILERAPHEITHSPRVSRGWSSPRCRSAERAGLRSDRGRAPIVDRVTDSSLRRLFDSYRRFAPGDSRDVTYVNAGNSDQYREFKRIEFIGRNGWFSTVGPRRGVRPAVPVGRLRAFRSASSRSSQPPRSPRPPRLTRPFVGGVDAGGTVVDVLVGVAPARSPGRRWPGPQKAGDSAHDFAGRIRRRSAAERATDQ